MVFYVDFFISVDVDDCAFPEICSCEVKNLISENVIDLFLLGVLSEFLYTLSIIFDMAAA